jgi:hypothetical protein
MPGIAAPSALRPDHAIHDHPKALQQILETAA